MKNGETFESVIEKLRVGRIGREEATRMLHSLKKKSSILHHRSETQDISAPHNMAEDSPVDQIHGQIPATRFETQDMSELRRTDEGSPVDQAHGQITAIQSEKQDLSGPHSTDESSQVDHAHDRIAVIGMSGQFPDAGDLDTFWRNLIGGHDGVGELPVSYLTEEKSFNNGKITEKNDALCGGVLRERDCFDPLFFNISPLEAESMNPHQRLILQESWKGLEHAGYNPKSFANSKVGVFIGAEPTGYAHESFTGASDAIIASRLSYFLNLKGPALVVNTGCSSSGVAVHLACESLRNKESSLAIAGGVFAAMTQTGISILSEIGMCSKEGRCRTFDRSADGTAFSEGVGVVVLKRLGDAVSAGDTIYGIILGSGMNQDGTSNGITAPNGVSQEALIADVYRRYRIDPEEIGYIEAHGTGTQLGDTVEANALVRAFRQFTDKKHYCRVGSAKAHIGHPSASAGVIGLIKVLLSIEHRMIPGLLNFKELNPMIEFDDSAFYINTRSERWSANDDRPLTAALNSFGHSGTNVHLVVGEYIPPVTQKEISLLIDEGNSLLIPLSAKTEESLKAGAESLLLFLESEKSTGPDKSHRVRPMQQRIDPVNLAYTLQVGREAMSTRVVFFVDNLEELEDKLKAFIAGKRSMPGCLQGLVDEDNRHELCQDEETEEMHSRWIAEGNLLKIGELWVQGVEPDWNLLYGNVKPRRIGLPTYAFSRERYWLPEAADSAGGRVVDSGDSGAVDSVGNRTVGSAGSRVVGSGDSRAVDSVGSRIVDSGGSRAVDSADSSAVEREDGRAGSREDGRASRKSISAGTEPLQAVLPLHPLVNQNTSNLSEQRFSTTFTGEEFFLADHRVQGEKVLPGVAYLEMARAALERATEIIEFSKGQGLRPVRLRNIVWVRPIAVNDHEQEVHIGIHVKKDDELHFEIYTRPGTAEDAPVVHGQGTGSFGPVGKANPLDLPGLKAEIKRMDLSPAECYETLKAAGVDHGPAYRGIRKIHAGNNQVLAKLALPSCVSGTRDQFVLHPSIMDSALQASVGLATAPGPSITPSLPFALEELEVLSPCQNSMWSWIRPSEGNRLSGNIQKLDIDLCDEQGRICVRMKGFSSRILSGKIGSFEREEEGVSRDYPQKMMLTPVWNALSFERPENSQGLPDSMLVIGATKEQMTAVQELYPQAGNMTVQPRDTIDTVISRLQAHGPVEHLVWIAPSTGKRSFMDKGIISEQNQGVLQAFRIIKALLFLGHGNTDLTLTLITTLAQEVRPGDPACKEMIDPTHAGVHGLAGSLAKEYPHWNVRLFDLEPFPSRQLKEVFSLEGLKEGDALAYRNGEWYRQELMPIKTKETASSLYRSEGVYVVIGGAGGIGTAWSRFMIERYRAQIIWIGRRKEDALIRSKLSELAAKGPSPRYIRADAGNRKALAAAYGKIKEQFGEIHGVIHSAIILKDQSLSAMDEATFKAGLSAKVDTSVHMAQVFGEEPLDFILFFSSIVAFGKAAGQSNYAAGSTFKDAFARRLAKESAFPIKIMNWGYWGSVGIVSSREYRERMTRSGLASIEPEEGMEALDTLLESPINQMALVKTSIPAVWEGIETSEWMTGYGENFPSCIDELQRTILEQVQITPCLSPENDKQYRKMEKLLCRILHGQLYSLGLFSKEKFKLSEMKKCIAWIDLYDLWFEESMAALVRAGYLKSHGDDRGEAFWSVLDSSIPDMDGTWREWDLHKEEWLEDEELKAQTLLVERVMRALPEILTGRIPATEIIFPDASLELVEEIYKGNPVSDYFNDVLADNVVTFLTHRLGQDRQTRLRILEIGAGTGGTTARVLPQLRSFQANLEEYCYTDISQAFLIHAQKEFAQDYPYLQTALFDVEKPPGEQNIPAGSYDLVIAVNVLHATKNIRNTLRNVKATLARNGLLILNEMSMNPLGGHLTFGLLKGWWLPEDRHLRIPGSPALSPEMWRKALAGEGFNGIFFPVEKAHDLGHQIIIAESDGIVRQKYITVTRAGGKTDNGIESESPAAFKEVPDDLLREKGTAYIKKLVGQTLKIPGTRIKSSTPLEKYGIDSILVVQLTNAMNKVFDDIAGTLFFEYQTIDALVEHFISTRKNELMGVVGLENRTLPEHDPRQRELSSEPVAGFSPTINRRFLPSLHAQEDRFEPRGNGIFDVAVIGLAGRYAKADNVEEFWCNLKEGKNCITTIPQDRWDWKKYYHEEKGKEGTVYTKWGGFIGEIDKFDPLFFHISPREAELMDPQERLFLETVYHSIEDAGYTPENLCDGKSSSNLCDVKSSSNPCDGKSPAKPCNDKSLARRKIGVFAGVMNGTYTRASSYASIANRVSYLLNFHGPSMAVDTACSSSLTAIHLALESLYSGTSDCAVAGGVNLIVDPLHYLRLSAMNVLSPGERCSSFGCDADGIVDGEGVGAVVLKPLADAIGDNDHIYGVIKGSMVNAGGKTNGYTVPNPLAQSALISEALERSKVDARTISCVEAHGTGTILGDPIEIAGLTRAFGDDTKEKQFCAIGSAKSNIGHCESAAGIAGVTKVLMQLKHGMLAPSLHAAKLNPNINFSATPFFVNRQLCPWQPPVIEGKAYPRRAGISSFGAGGSNAHIIIEEYIHREERKSVPELSANHKDSAVVVLSAGSEERLRVHVRQLTDFLQNDHTPESPMDLSDMAYTLQVGRVPMEYRLGVIASSIEELMEKLRGFLSSRDFGEQADEDGLHLGRVKPDDETLTIFDGDEAMGEALEKWIQQRKTAKLLSLWVRGLTFDWNKLYGEKKPRRISLPGYPFEKNRYWLKEGGEFGGPAAESARVLHPLVHENVSTFQEQSFRTVFTGQEFFLKDHMVKGQKVLPAVAYLEMARAAVEQSLGYGEENEASPAVGLGNVVWVRPLTVGGDAGKVRIKLFCDGTRSGEQGPVRYEIHTEPGPGNGASVMHSQGLVSFGPRADAAYLDLDRLQKRINRKSLTPEDCYAGYGAMGIEYGPGHRGVAAIHVGNRQVLAKLVLPPSVSETRDHFILHPAIMDSALQASMGLALGTEDSKNEMGIDPHPKPSIPFALEEIEISGRCTDSMWAWIRYSHGSAPGDKVQKFDIDICDEEGKIAVRMNKVSSRMLHGVPGGDDKREELSSGGLTLMSPVWNGAFFPENSPLLPEETAQVLIVGGSDHQRDLVQRIYPHAVSLTSFACDSTMEQPAGILDQLAGKLKGKAYLDHIVWIAPDHSIESPEDSALIQGQTRGVLQLFAMVKALLSMEYGVRDLGWTLITTQTFAVRKKDPLNPLHAGIQGFAGSLAAEYPHWKIRLLDLEAGCEWPVEKMFTLPFDARGEGLAHRRGEWFRQTLIPVREAVCESEREAVCESDREAVGESDREVVHELEREAVSESVRESVQESVQEPVPELEVDRSLYRTEGVYVVIGGSGGIGEAWSRYMIENYRARIIWIGRRKKEGAIQEKLDAFSKSGPVPVYIQADARDRNALQKACDEIKQNHRMIHGVVHSAIVLEDQGLAGMDEKRFKRGFSAKVDVSVRLAQVFQGEPLDFVLFFSSMIAFVKSPGQSNYAAGCTFKDAFARSLALEWPCKVKIMNWGYWGSVGIVKGQAQKELMEHFGMGSIEPEEGMDALETLLRGPLDQMALVKTVRPKGRAADSGDSMTTCSDSGDSMTTCSDSGEWMTTYVQTIPSCIEDLPKQLPAGKSQTEALKSLEDPRNSAMEEIILRLLLDGLQSLWLLENTSQSPLEPGTQKNILGFYGPWFEESISLLKAKGYLPTDKKSFTKDSTVDPDSLWKEWDRAKAGRQEDEKAHLVLVEACLRVLPEILTGKKKAVDILFPDSSMALVEGIYKGNTVADLFNEALGSMVTAYIEERLSRDGSARIRILEIGAGTGGTTAPLLSKLRPFKEHIEEYCYTDVSRAFLLHAKEQYAPRNPYLTTAIFDVEKTIAAQGIRADHYDLVIAANVLHATGNVRETLRNAKAPLRKKGLIFLNELSSNSVAGHLTFGLLEGWWRYEDHALRIPGCPGLNRDTWTRVLEEEGFDTVLFPAESARELGQRIIVAESDGIVRQRQTGSVPGKEGRGHGVLEEEGGGTALFPGESVREPGQQIIVDEGDGTVRKRQSASNTEKVKRGTGGADEFGEPFTRSLPAERAAESGENSALKIPVRKITPESLREKTTAYLKKIFAETLKMPAHQIDTSRPMEAYGMDSILSVHLTNTLHRHFENISSTLFFEVQTIDALAEHLIRTEKEALMAQVGFEEEGGREKGIEEEGNREKRFEKHGRKEKTLGRGDSPSPSSMIPFKSGFGKPGSSVPIFKREKEDDKSRIYRVQDVAVIGLSGRYPLSKDLNEFWSNLEAGKNCITQIPEDRWDWRRHFDEKRGKKGRSYTRWGGFLEDVDKFDPLFFRISPKDAEAMDPQERLFLETAHAGIEDAGYTPATLCAGRKIGVFVGVMNSMYSHRTSYWSIANRVSYTLDFQGPSLAVDTACSASLSAIHLALESLYCGSSECAVAGGVNLILDPRHYVLLSEMTMVSSSDRCKSFGAHADGFVDGEGVGAVVLKPLDRAVADRDHIYGIIKGSMINAGGKTNGFTVPNPVAQSRLISDTLKRAGVHGEAVSYMEAHGTATVLGDPIEITGLTRAFETASTDKNLKEERRKQYCAIGSVKSNIGHCESAAGIAAITKVLLQMKHGRLAPSLHCEELNPNIDFQNTPFVVQKELREWKRPLLTLDGKEKEYPRIAGISSFGAGGANAHLIIEEYIPGEPGEKDHTAPEHAELNSSAGKSFLIVLSAKNEDRLKKVAVNLLGMLKDDSPGFHPEKTDMADLAYTLQVGREAMEERLGMIVGSMDELSEKLAEFLGGASHIDEFYRGQVKRNREAMAVLSGDRDMAGLVNGWMEARKYPKLLELWVKGFDVHWNRLYGNQKPSRISLPTYPFARERHWISERERHGVSEMKRHGISERTRHGISERERHGISEGERHGISERERHGISEGERHEISEVERQGNSDRKGHGISERERPEISDREGHWSLGGRVEETLTLESGNRMQEVSWDGLTYLPGWEELPVSMPEEKESSHRLVLIVSCDGSIDLGKTILADYRRNHPATRLIQIHTGEETRQLEDDKWCCGVDDAGGFGHCLKEYSAIDGVYFISAHMGEDEPFNPDTLFDPDTLLRSQQNNEIQLLRLIKVLRQQSHGNHFTDCYMLTLDNHRTAGSATLPRGGGITGLAFAVAQGDHRFLVRNIDLSREDLVHPERLKALPEMIAHEPPSHRGEVIKFKAGARFRQTFFKLVRDRHGRGASLRTGGVYVIVGGSGTVGANITRYLIEDYGARVIWVGRKPGTSTVIQEKIASYHGLGEPPFYIQADVTRLDSIKQAVGKIKQEHGAIHGAVFSAIVFNLENSLARTTEEEFRRILDVKTKGSLNFYTAFQEESPDFLLFFSSGQAFSFSGAANLSAYAAGITFSDTFIQSIQETSRFPVGTINWGFWNASLEGISMGENVSALEHREGFECFESFISGIEEGHFNRLLCMKASESVEALMNINEEEVVISCPGSVLREQSLKKMIDEEKEGQGFWIKSDCCEEFDEELREWVDKGQAEELGMWLARLLFVQLRNLTIFSQKDVSEKISALQKRAGVMEQYDRWWLECLKMLETCGYLKLTGERVEVCGNTSFESQEELWRKWNIRKAAFLDDPEIKTSVALVDDCLRNLPGILKGTVPATDILFPDASMEKVAGIYKNNRLSDYFNGVVARSAGSYVGQLLEADPRAGIRIMEIGAGTGGTTSMVLPELHPFQGHIVEYCYTDISRVFLRYGEEQYGPGCPFLTYRMVNVEEPLADQGIDTGAYDMVIAANVLHATKNIGKTLRNAKSALKPRGVIILNELSDKSLISHLTFGLLKGWWRYEDAELRISGSPGLYPDTWKKVLEEEGFTSILFPAEAAHRLGQQIIIARNNGLTRRKLSGPGVQEEAGKSRGIEPSPVVAPPAESFPVSGESAENLKHHVSRLIFGSLSRALKIPKASIDPDTAFSDYGMDSVGAADFVGKIGEGLGISMNSAIVFDYSNVNHLTDYVIDAYGERIGNDGNPSSVTGQSLHDGDRIRIDKNSSSVTGQAFPAGDRIGIDKDSSFATGQSLHDRDKGKPNRSKQFNHETVSPLKWFQEQDDSRAVHKKLQEQNVSTAAEKTGETTETSAIAVVGMSGQFPGAEDLHAFWQNLVEGVDGVRELPDRYSGLENSAGSCRPKGKGDCPRGGVLEERDCFDPLFFKIAPREAESMNPHQRLILQESWKGLEDAGYNPVSLSGSSAGMFIGAEPSGYYHKSFTGASDAIIASRLSYYLNLTGPAMVVNTGCSSSATAIHLACESLRNKESGIALAGGVFAGINKGMLDRLADIEMLSASGRCSTFDASADGTAFSEGVGVVVLKRLGDAVADGDRVYGVIEGSGVNQDGAGNGMTAPNGRAQEALISSVYRRYRIDPAEISYVEAHGTGTKLGDPVEANALVRAFKKFTEKKHYCAVGSAKSHIGHTSASAGVIGLIKVLLSMQHRMIPGMLHFKQLNPLIEFEDSPFFVNTESMEWRSKNGRPLKAALSSFGHSGTNVHLVVGEYVKNRERIERLAGAVPCADHGAENREPCLIVMSARNEERLKEHAGRLLEFIRRNSLTEAEEIISGSANSAGNIPLNSLKEVKESASASAKSADNIPLNSLKEADESASASAKSAGNIPMDSLKEVEESASVSMKSAEKKPMDSIEETDESPSANAKSIEKRSGESRKTLEDKVRGILSEIIGVPYTKIEVSESFEEYGVEPIHRIRLLETLGEELDITLHSREFLEKDSIALIVGKLLKNYFTPPELPGTTAVENNPKRAMEKKAKVKKNRSSIDLRDLAYTLQVGREAMEERLGFVVETVEQLEEALGRFLAGDDDFDVPGGRPPVNIHRGRVKRSSETMAVFTADEDMTRAIAAWIEKRKYSKLLTLWVKGLAVDWSKLYGSGTRPCRMGLPTYPFSKKRYGVKVMKVGDEKRRTCDEGHPAAFENRSEPTEQSLGQASGGQEFLPEDHGVREATPFPDHLSQSDPWDGLAYLPKWEEQPVSLPEQENRAPRVIVVVSHGESAQLEETLCTACRRNHPRSRVIRIRLGEKTRQVSDNEWCCGVDDPGGFERCLQDTPSIDGVYFISAHGGKGRLHDPNAFGHSSSDSEALVHSASDPDELLHSPLNNEIQLLRLVGFLGQKLGSDDALDCHILTLDNQLIEKGSVNAHGGGLAGLAYALAQADHRFRVRNIDLSGEDLAHGIGADSLLDMIFHEPPSDRGEVVKFKSGMRYKQAFFKLDWNHFHKASALKRGGVYVILGGSGSVGGVMTRHLIRNYRARVIWLGRSPETSPVIKEKIAAYHGLGEPPVYIRADATSRDSMEQAVGKIKEEHPVINGAVFSGLVFNRECPLNEITETQFRETLDVKTEGNINFFSAFEKERLDFMCFFSSVQSFSFLSAKDSAAYAAGITFSDAFVGSIDPGHHFPVGIINWGFWEDTTMGTELEKRLTRHFGLISDHDGFSFFEKFTGLLQKRIINRILCLSASTAVEKLMNCNGDEVISLCEQGHDSIIQSLWEDYENK